MDVKLKKYVKRCNDALFKYEDSVSSVMNYTIILNDRIKQIPPLHITSFLHSGIGNGMKVTISLSSDYVSMDSSALTATCDEESDEEGENNAGEEEKDEEKEE